MPEYLAPAVYVEETSFRAKSIEGVSTSTTGFVGPTSKGPTTGTPEIITSYGDFERIYGGFTNLSFAPNNPNYIAHSVRHYFDNGGSRLFVARVFQALAADNDGVAGSGDIGDGADHTTNISFVARTPGSLGNGTITVSLVTALATDRTMQTAPNGSYVIDGSDAYVKQNDTWFDDTGTALAGSVSATAVFVTINILTRDADGDEASFEDMGLAQGHPRYVGDILNENPGRRIAQLENTFAIDIGNAVDAFRLHELLSGITAPVMLTGGNDGGQPGINAYDGPLDALARIEDISIVAAPGYTTFTDAVAIQNALINHAERRRAYRIAVLDIPFNRTTTDAIADKARIDSSYAAIYYPWIYAANPLARPNDESTPREVLLPPSGFVCGIYARNDNAKGVSKSPGNEIVQNVNRFETDVSFAEQELLNPRGVNCLRYFPGRGNRLWGARTASSDPEWKYVGPRRYFIYLEHSIDRSTQWAVFENNGPLLWANVRETVEAFLYNEFRSGALLGSTEDEAYFVRCDRTTMTQHNLDNGQLICLIGVAVLKPAEFVIFRIGQKTADSRS